MEKLEMCEKHNIPLKISKYHTKYCPRCSGDLTGQIKQARKRHK